MPERDRNIKKRLNIKGNICSPATVLLSAALVFSGCGVDSPSHPAETIITPRVDPNTFVIPENDSLFLHHREGDEYFLVFASHPPLIEEKTIIIGSGDGGYIRRVLSSRIEEKIMILQTEQAYLTDVLISGKIDTFFMIGPGSIGTTEKQSFSTPSASWLYLSGLSLFRAVEGQGEASVYIKTGYIEYNPVLRFGLSIRGKEIIELHAIAEGPVSIYCSIHADLPESFDYSGEIPVASFLKKIVIQIGEVPVPVELCLEFIATIEMEGEYAGICETGYSGSAEIITGIEYSEGAWSAPGSESNSFSPILPVCESFSSGNIRVSLKPSIDIRLFGRDGFHLGIQSCVNWSSTTDIPPFWIWELENLIRSDCTFDTGILSGSLPGCFLTDFESDTLLAVGPFRTDDYIFVRSWGSYGTGDGQFSLPGGITSSPDGSILVCDNDNNRIQEFQPDSTFVASWGTRGDGQGQFSFPTGIATDSDGNIYVVDKGNYRIQKFTSSGSFITSWGGPGDDNGQFRGPEDITVSNDGDILVVDNFTGRVQKFTSSGVFLEAWGESGSLPGQLGAPMGIACDNAGNIYISECLNHRIQKFTDDGTYIRGWGVQGSGELEFNCPANIVVGPEENIYISDYGNNRILKYTTDGTFISSLGGYGVGQGQFDHPFGIVVTENGYIYVCDSCNRRIQVFAPLPATEDEE